MKKSIIFMLAGAMLCAICPTLSFAQLCYATVNLSFSGDASCATNHYYFSAGVWDNDNQGYSGGYNIPTGHIYSASGYQTATRSQTINVPDCSKFYLDVGIGTSEDCDNGTAVIRNSGVCNTVANGSFNTNGAYPYVHLQYSSNSSNTANVQLP